MRTSRRLLHRAALGAAGLGLLAAPTLALVSCADDASGSGSDERDAGELGSRPDAAVTPRDAEAPVTNTRFAHFAPDLGPLDFCYRASGTSTFLGPVLGTPRAGARGDAGGDAAADADADAATTTTTDAASRPDAGAAATSTSIAYREVTRYVGLARSGPLDVAVVTAGSSCAAPLLVRTVTLDPGKLSTVLVLGRAGADAGTSSELGLVALVDDRTTQPEKARVRLVNAALPLPPSAAPPVGVRATSGTTIVLADRVDPRKASTPSAMVPVDALGYATVSALPPPASLSVSAAAPAPNDAAVEAWESAATDLDLRGGSLHTGFVVIGEGTPFEIVWCRDTSTEGDLTACARVR